MLLGEEEEEGVVVGEAVGEGVVPGVVVLFVDAEGGLHGAAVVVGEEFGVETREVEGVFFEVVVGCEVFEQGSAEDGFADGEDFSLSCLVTLDLAHFQLLEFLGCCVRRSVRK